jgi:hypothetical protein
MENEKIEIWIVLPSNENYLISDLGRVQVLPRFTKSGSKLKGKMLNFYSNLNGYLSVNIYDKKIYVHQLVAEAFLDHAPCGHKIIVDHINNVSTDNRLINLQLISNRENLSKDKKGGTSKYVGVHFDKRAKKWRSEIQIKGKVKHIGYFICEEAASKSYQDELNKLNIS